MKNLLFLILLTFIINSSYGQSVSGEVQDPEGKPLSFANVLLINSTDSLLVKGTVTAENGFFKIENVAHGSYIAAISMVGYKKTYSEIFSISANHPDQKFPLFIVVVEDQQLNEVTIEAQKPLYEKQMDRLVVNVQQSITAAGNSVLEVLQKSPGVNVNRQNNSIILNGKTGITVMVNNKITRLPIDAVVQMLDGMSAANVEKIELITNPPAKYDAEGSAGIIHIVMKESADLGTNGNYGVTMGRNGDETLGTNFNINHRRKIISFFADYSIHYDHNKELTINELQINKSDYSSHFYSSTTRRSFTTVQNLRAGSEINLGKKTTAGALVTLYQRHYKQKANTDLYNTITPDSSRSASIEIGELNRWQSFTANLNLIHNFNERSILRLDLDYLNYNNYNPSYYHNYFYYPEINLNTYQKIDIRKETPIFIKVGNIDYSFRPTSSLLLETGFKRTSSSFINDVEVDYTEEGLRNNDPELSAYSDLEENITAGYVTSEWKINEKSQFNAGLRYEHTSTIISTLTEKGIVDRNFGNFFPSFFFKRTFSDQTGIFLGYSRRITRPTFNDMAPFVFIWDPNTFFSGNPALLPAIIDGFKLDFTVKRAIITFDYSNSKNEIARFQPEIDPNTNRQTLRSQNLEYQEILNLSFSIPWILTEWWDVQSNSSFFYRNLKSSHLNNNVSLSFYNFSLNLVNNIKLPKDFALEISGIYESKMIWGMWIFKPLGSVNIGLQKKLSGNKGIFRLSANDIFYTNVFKLHSYNPEYNAESNLLVDFNVQSFNLTYTRSFGNNKLKAVFIKSGSEEERKRVQ